MLQLSTRNILKTVKNITVLRNRRTISTYKTKFIKEDVIAAKESIDKILGDINGLKEQNIILQAITQSCSCNALLNWQKVCDDLPENIYVFIQKELIVTLTNNTNLRRWKKVDFPLCTLSKTNNQTQLHTLNNCPAVVRLGRYTWRHNSILYTMCHYLLEFGNAAFKLCADLIGFKSPTELFNRLTLDMMILMT